MHMETWLLLSIVAVQSLPSECARILGMFPKFIRSQHQMFDPLMRTLAEAGHEVVVYSPFPIPYPPPNYTNVYLENISVDSPERRQFFRTITDLPTWKSYDSFWEYYEDLYYEWIEDKEVKKLLTSDEKFDLVVLESWGIEFTLILGHVLKAPVVSVQTFYTNNLINMYTGNSLPVAFVPDHGSPFSDRMSFSERLYNALSTLRAIFLHYNMFLPRMETNMRKRFPDMPPLLNMIYNISLVFINDHMTVDYAQPRPPNMIPVAGLQIGPPKPLPGDIERFMDEATDGVVYFSLGSNIEDEIHPTEYFNMYKNVFKKLKQRVIWKTGKEKVEGLPHNVMILKWAPQESILAHQNCVLFITHGGLFSQHEAIHYGVPVIGIPHYFDQHRNVKFYEARGVGLRVKSQEISEMSMSAAIDEVLYNPRYRENMKKLSARFRDRPLSPAESVVFWTEYVLRHGGAPHLRPASTELRWYQLLLLDVVLLVSVFLLFSVTTIYLILRRIYFTTRTLVFRAFILRRSKSIKKSD